MQVTANHMQALRRVTSRPVAHVARIWFRRSIAQQFLVFSIVTEPFVHDKLIVQDSMVTTVCTIFMTTQDLVLSLSKEQNTKFCLDSFNHYALCCEECNLVCVV